VGWGEVSKTAALTASFTKHLCLNYENGSHSYDNAEPAIATTGKWHINQFVLAEWQKYTAISLSASG